MIVRLDDIFAELGGFALVDPARLDEFGQGQVQGRDLLTEFTTTAQGEKVLADGIVVPMLGVAPGYYRLVVRGKDDPSAITQAQIVSRGWVLGTVTGKLVLCGLGYLTKWDAQHLQHSRVDIEPGWYELEIQGRLLDASEGSEDGLYELILTKVDEKPALSASTTQSLSLLD